MTSRSAICGTADAPAVIRSIYHAQTARVEDRVSAQARGRVQAGCVQAGCAHIWAAFCPWIHMITECSIGNVHGHFTFNRTASGSWVLLSRQFVYPAVDPRPSSSKAVHHATGSWWFSMAAWLLMMTLLCHSGPAPDKLARPIPP